ncbi:hypothetical protein GBF38_022153, partial [Nibea albiflora]
MKRRQGDISNFFCKKTIRESAGDQSQAECSSQSEQAENFQGQTSIHGPPDAQRERTEPDDAAESDDSYSSSSSHSSSTSNKNLPVTTFATPKGPQATQNIAQRGHRESEDSGNKGNFLAILELIAKHDPLIKQKMEHSNAKYTSNHIQNEILEVLADMRLYVFLSGSYVHQKWQDIQRSMYPKDQPRELPRLSDIRWACRYYACRNLMDRLPAVLQVLHDIDEENNGDRSVEARGLRGQINLDFICLLATFKRVLGDTKFLSDMLQSSSLDLARAIDLIEALQDLMLKCRDESSFDQLWTEVLSMAQQCNISTERMSKRQLKTSSALNDTVVMSTVGQRYSDIDKDYLCKTVYYPILDRVNAELERRFSKTNCDIMRGIQALNPKSNSF